VVDEAARLLALIEAHEDITGQGAQTVIADARYGSVNNLIECQKARIHPHLKLLGNSHRGKGRSEGIYDEERFTFDPLTNTYRCPANALAPRALNLGIRDCQGNLPGVQPASVLYALPQRSHYSQASRSRVTRSGSQNC
jgi:hypothetical protein